jgi:hypothetical protein
MQTFQTQVRTNKNGLSGDTGNTERETKTTKANKIKTNKASKRKQTNKASKRKQTNKQITIQIITHTKYTDEEQRTPKKQRQQKKG